MKARYPVFVYILIAALVLACNGSSLRSLFAQEKKPGEKESQDSSAQKGESDKEGEKGSEGGKEEVKKDLTPPAPVIEIKRLESEEPLYSIELRDVELADLFRVVAHDYNLNVIVDKDVSGKITASFTNIKLEEALDAIAEISNLVLEKKKNIIKVCPNLITRTFVLNYLEANSLLVSSSSSSSESSSGSAGSASASGSSESSGQAGSSSSGSSGQGSSSSASGAEGGSSSSGEASSGSESGSGSSGSSKQANTIYDLLSDKGKVLLGKQPNSIMVIDYPPNIEKIEAYIKAIDKRMSSRVFKLKYITAADIVGKGAASSSGSQSGSSTAASSGSSSGSGSSSSSGSSSGGSSSGGGA